ncbi:hypothetical protein LC087_08900 [Bacillus carboniphilus]|uniref:Uncharacterized protein n=1 Tax=Bacillus carboniphilus TaxID=86663 RepID=A0ABY9K0C8_9BACI|nr:hypothetical protein [Bacillus carboniphilus]WLR44173.1 hypothetical protein LC087_08900 [Bacillus carboniphilus]
MYVLSRNQMAKEKVERIRSGLSAYAESEELSQKIKRELELQNISVHEDITEFGYWFIPVQENQHHIL